MAHKILILGNQGYIGPVLAAHLRQRWPDAELIGYDVGYFMHASIALDSKPDAAMSQQISGDVRNFDPAILDGVTGVVALAAISNDPMGNAFEKPTMEVNAHALARIAHHAKARGVKHFVFASSCSVYGAGGEDAKNEQASTNPLTAYARSKLACEAALEPLASDDFTITCHRFATACGFSPRLRLDLVLNDFVASALTSGKIQILSDGTPWRPLIDVRDMSRAMEWSLARDKGNGGNFLILNTGANTWNFTVKELAEAVALILPDTAVEINTQAAPDKRSYRVNFAQFEQLAPDHQPSQTIELTIADLVANLRAVQFTNSDFRESEFIRLNTLRRLQAEGALDNDLNWAQKIANRASAESSPFMAK